MQNYPAWAFLIVYCISLLLSSRILISMICNASNVVFIRFSKDLQIFFRVVLHFSIKQRTENKREQHDFSGCQQIFRLIFQHKVVQKLFYSPTLHVSYQKH